MKSFLRTVLPISKLLSDEAGGVLGQKLELIGLDGKGAADDSVAAYKQLNVIIAGNLNAKYSLADAFLHTPKQKHISQQIEEQALALLEIVNLVDYKDARADSLPYGHQRRLEKGS